MTDRPILFSAPMINAMLAARKTQTRRLLSPQPESGVRFQGLDRDGLWLFSKGCAYGKLKPPYAVGDRIYVRETYFQCGHWEPVAGRQTKGGRQKWAFVPADHLILFDAPASFRKGRHAADPATIAWHQRLGRFMPRAASRLTLIVEAVRVERLQAISEADAQAEGCDPAPLVMRNDYLSPPVTYKAGYHALWDHLHGAGSWDDNPFVVAVSFRVVRGNIDQVPA